MSTFSQPQNDASEPVVTAENVEPWAQALWRSAKNLFWERPPTIEELSFRASYMENARRNIQHGLVLSMGIALLYMFGPGPIARLRTGMLTPDQIPFFDLLRFTVFLPTTVLLFAVVFSPLYKRYFTLATQFVALAHVVALTGLEVLIRKQGYSTAVWMAILVYGIFSAYGLHERQAIRTALLAIGIYFFGAHSVGTVTPQWHFEFGLLALGLLGGAATQASLFNAERAHHSVRLALTASAERDGLLQIYNRRAFDERIASMWSQAIRTHTSVAVFMIDIDHFKHYNDSQGHLAGDECLKKVAATLSLCARRPLDIVARYGGEEFAILLFDIDHAGAEATARTLCEHVADLKIPHPASPNNKFITVSVGAACVVPKATRSFAGFIQLADEALYSAKQHGRNRSVALHKEYESLVTGVFSRRSVLGEKAA